MDDEAAQLASDERLFRLLEHYHAASGDDRSRWADRVMEIESETNLTHVHGSLLAPAWLEINSSAEPVSGGIGKCYRITHAGSRALKRAQIIRDGRDDITLEAAAVAADEPSHS